MEKTYYYQKMESFIPSINGGKIISASAEDALSKIETYFLSGEVKTTEEMWKWRNFTPDFNEVYQLHSNYYWHDEQVQNSPRVRELLRPLESEVYDIRYIVKEIQELDEHLHDEIIRDIVAQNGWHITDFYSDAEKIEQAKNSLAPTPAAVLLELILEYNYHRIGSALYGEEFWQKLRNE